LLAMLLVALTRGQRPGTRHAGVRLYIRDWERPYGEDMTRTQMVGKGPETSDALDPKPRVFRAHDPKRIASLKRSALRSRRRKASPFPAAMQDRQLSADSGRSSDCGGVGIRPEAVDQSV
jgi:hypothetical protein